MPIENQEVTKPIFCPSGNEVKAAAKKKKSPTRAEVSRGFIYVVRRVQSSTMEKSSCFLSRLARSTLMFTWSPSE